MPGQCQNVKAEGHAMLRIAAINKQQITDNNLSCVLKVKVGGCHAERGGNPEPKR